jgi:phenylalanyl-tRNA synthetase beta chain
MKFSEKWLREWVDPPVTTMELVEQLTMAGLEVDSVERLDADIEGLVVGQVLSVEKHPDADKLRVCMVNAGQGEALQIVCGAPDVRTGGKYPLALIGARLPGDITIRKSRLRGVESHGMLCSARELGLGDAPQGLLELPTEIRAGEDIRTALGLDDVLIEVDLTPNRGDCLGIEGIAREVGALTRSPVTSLDITAVPPVIQDTLAIQVQAPDACPRYLGRVIRGIDPTASTPRWMQERLRRSGLRAIAPVVDVTNYVLLELGQPMHAFDMAQLAGGVSVRYAFEDEQLTLLDERTVTLDAGTLVIADSEKPLAIAGVMGGIHSGVSETSTDIFLECAYFSPEVIAGRARKFAIQTDSAHRFERGVDPGLQRRAIERATALLMAITGGQPGPVRECSSLRHLPVRASIALAAGRIERLLGLTPEPAVVTDILERLGMVVISVEGGWRVTPPSFRFDIGIEADLIEEIGRVYGYDKLPSQAPLGALEMPACKETDLTVERIAQVLVDLGYQEAITYSFVEPGFQQALIPNLKSIALENPISSEMSVMRTSLWPGLLKAVRYNLNRQTSRLRIFESGLRFYSEDNEIKQEYVIGGVLTGTRHPENWSDKSVPVDFFDARHDIETLFAFTGRADEYQFVRDEHPALHPGQSARLRRGDRGIGWLGRIHPVMADRFDLDPATYLFEFDYAAVQDGMLVQFKELSRYPSIRRDLAIVTDLDVTAEELQAEVRRSAGALLRDMVIFDVYQGKGIETGRKSVAFGLILQDSSRTLTDDDVEVVVDRVTECLNKKFGAVLRE